MTNKYLETLEKIKERVYRNLAGNHTDDEDKMTASEIAQAMRLLEVNGELVEPVEPGNASRYLQEEDEGDLPEFEDPPDKLKVVK